jgi:hypothetical protein
MSISHFALSPIRTRTLSGFSVVALVRFPFEDMFERIQHPAVFADEARAQRFMAKVKRCAANIDLNQWILPTSNTSYIRNETNPISYLVQ